jgi:hypothetical protein
MELEHLPDNKHVFKCEKCKENIIEITGGGGSITIPMGKVTSFIICGECYEKGDFTRNLR